MFVWIFWIIAVSAAVIVVGHSSELTLIESELRAVSVNILRSAGAGLPEDGLAADTVVLWSACLVVWGAFAFRFNGWPSRARGPVGFPEHGPRYFTTRFRFRAWAVLYGLVITGLFLVLVFFPTVADQAMTLVFPLMPDNEFLSEVDKVLLSVSPGGDTRWSVAAAVGIVVAFYSSDWERRLRGLFQNNALIPRQAEQLFEELSRPDTAEPISGRFADEFLMQFRQREDLPAYDEIDLNPTARDLAQKRLERLARIEFILWRMTRGELPEEVAARLAEHDRLRGQLVDKVERIRAEVAAIDTQVVRVANLLLKHVAGEHLPAFRERLGHAAGLKEIGATLTSIPVSRLDDVIPVLKAEFNRIVETEPSSAGAGFAPPAGADDDVQKTIEDLHRQIASLRGLVPLCAKSMEVQSERLRDLSEKLEDLWDETLRFAICIGLAAPYSSCKRFFGLLGLRPRIGVDFNLWLGLAFPMVLLFVLAVLYLSGKLPFAGGPFATWKGISDPERPVWLILGLFFICWPLLQGCYVGSALAHGRQAESGAEHHDRMRPQDYLLSFLMIWSVLVLGVSLLIAICGFSGRFPFIYVQALAYAPVSALWGVLVSAAALRALDPRARGGVIRGREVGGLLLLVAVGVKLAEAWIASELSEAQGGAEVPGGVLMGLALGLSAVLSGAIWVGTSKGVNGLLERWQPPRLTGTRAAG